MFRLCSEYYVWGRGSVPMGPYLYAEGATSPKNYKLTSSGVEEPELWEFQCDKDGRDAPGRFIPPSASILAGC